MQLVVRIIAWSNHFSLLQGYPDMCSLLEGLEALTWMHYAARGIYYYYYEPHLEKLGKAPRACRQRPLFFFSTKETVYTCA